MGNSLFFACVLLPLSCWYTSGGGEVETTGERGVGDAEEFSGFISVWLY